MKISRTKKRFFAMSLIVMLVLSAFPARFAASYADDLAEGLVTRTPPRRAATLDLRITGQIPLAQLGGQIYGAARLNEELNARFMAQHDQFVQAHLASAFSLHFTTEVFTSGDFVSVVFIKEATGASVSVSASTTVIDVEAGRIISLTEFNINALQLINRHIRSIIAENPRNFSNFTGITSEHPFYLNDDILVIPFGSAVLIPTLRDLHHIQLNLANIQNELLGPDYFFTLPPSQYNTKMVRLAEVADRFNFTLSWNYETNTAYIYKGNDLISSVTIGENAYFYRNLPVRALEVAPMLYNDRTYVPLSFFVEILGITAAVDAVGNIVLSAYHAPPRRPAPPELDPETRQILPNMD